MKLEERLDKLKEMTEVQCSNGNWNYDPYMHGMIFCEALMQDKDPVFLDAPKVWLHDKRSDGPAESAIIPGEEREDG